MSAAHPGAAVYLVNSQSRLENCAISDNLSGVQGAGVYLQDSQVRLVNSILSNNGPQSVIRSEHNSSIIEYCFLDDESEIDPHFVQTGYWEPGDTASWQWVAGDYHLQSEQGHWDAKSARWIIDELSSPGLDAGHPGYAWQREPIPNGQRTNQGAYGGSSQASKSNEEPKGLRMKPEQKDHPCYALIWGVLSTLII